MTFDRNQGAQRSRQMRETVRDIGTYLDHLGANIGLDSSRTARRGTSTILWSKDNKLIGEFASPELADFIRRAPGWLAELINHVKHLEEVAFEQRRERRRMQRVGDELAKAASSGFTTATGEYHLQLAYDALRSRDDDIDRW